MTDEWRLDLLPSDVLLLIFDYCHVFDLVRLSEVCKRFHNIIGDDTLWIKKSKKPLVTNQTSKRFRERCNPVLCLRRKWHVSSNWQLGKFNKRILFSQRTKLMPWLQLRNDTLWWCGGNRIRGFQRTDHMDQSHCIFDEDRIRSDVCKFVVREDYIISGHRDGSLQFWTKARCRSGHLHFSIDRAHSCDVNAVDETSQAIISGAGDGTVKVWVPFGETIVNVPSATFNVFDRIWSIAADPMGTKFAVGSSGRGAGPPLHIFDLECSSGIPVRYNWRRGAGILDMVWEDPNTLLTCGYDTYIHKWDIRTGTCVSSWPDPTDATVYCISSDYNYSMVTGTQYSCKAVLWDQRQRGYVQLYFLNVSRISSPLYSIAFDSSHLYGATDQHLVELKFSGYSYKEVNYRDILQNEWTRCH